MIRLRPLRRAFVERLATLWPAAVARCVAAVLPAAVALLFSAGALAAQQGVEVPAPTGLVNDFAGVLPPDRVAHMERLAQLVRDKSKGEIAIVTLRDIGTRDVGDVALRIGRQWGVGAKGEAGDSAKNAGVVVLLVPRETSSDGKGHISIQTGRGVEGFITDADAGDIRREATPLLQQHDYGAALDLITLRLAQRFASNYTFALDSADQSGTPMVLAPGLDPRVKIRRPGRGGGFPWGLLVFVVIFLLLSRRGRRSGCIPLFINTGGGGGGWSSGGGGFGGGDSGGFGGFGGGGGFSGGGSSGDF